MGSKYLLSILLMFISGCSSYRNISESGAGALGGGFTTTQLAEGIFKVTAKTNYAPFINYSGAYKTLNRRASELCQQAGFELHYVNESNYDHIPGLGELRYTISQVQAVVYCGDSESRIEEVMSKIEKERIAVATSLEKEVAATIDEGLLESCHESGQFDFDAAFKELEKLKTSGRYKEAIACYENIISYSKDPRIKIDSYLNLSVIYELGLGVNVDIAKAIYFVAKAEELQ